MTAIEISDASLLHNASVMLVLPAPTGPPMPTRNGPYFNLSLIMFDISLDLLFRASLTSPLT